MSFEKSHHNSGSISNKEVIAIIPARSGSRSINHKNLQLVKGHPLLAYAIAAAKLSTKLSRVFVSTDSEHYAKIAVSYGAEAPFLRPKNISAENSGDIEFFKHFLDWIDTNESSKPELIVQLRPTSPFRTISTIDGAIKFMLSKKDVTSLRSCEVSVQTPYKTFYDQNGFIKPILELEGVKESYNLPRQKFPTVYVPNGHVDIIRPNIITHSGSLHGDKIKLWKSEPIPDIDTMADLEYANYVANFPKFKYLIDYLNTIKAHSNV